MGQQLVDLICYPWTHPGCFHPLISGKLAFSLSCIASVQESASVISSGERPVAPAPARMAVATQQEQRAASAGRWPHNLELREGSSPSMRTRASAAVYESCSSYSSHKSFARASTLTVPVKCKTIGRYKLNIGQEASVLTISRYLFSSFSLLSCWMFTTIARCWDATHILHET